MSVRVDPFDPRSLAELIRGVQTGETVNVMTHESSTKEFKENFTWGSLGLYARTMAAYANARGGYIIFGVTDNPRQLVGLRSKSLARFDNLDQAQLTQGLNDLFSTEIHWQATIYEVVEGRTVGLIYTHESENKPVVAKTSYQLQNGNIVEGDIVYRYNSRTERIKYPELRRLLDDVKSREQRQMMRHVEELVRAGAANAAVLDFTSSTLQGPSGQRVLIDSELLNQISFIREGEFDEVAGSPTLKLVGELQAATTVALGPARVIKGALSTEDVLLDFFSQREVSGPEEYIRVIATGSTSFLPVQFYRTLAGLSNDGLIEYVSGINSRAQSKKKLLRRLENGDLKRLSPPSASTQHESTVERRAFWAELVGGNVNPIAITDVRRAQYFAEAVKSLTDEQIAAIFEPLMDSLKVIFDTYYDSDAKVADGVRRAACRIDVATFSTPTAEPTSE
jgi:hypothetical protein